MVTAYHRHELGGGEVFRPHWNLSSFHLLIHKWTNDITWSPLLCQVLCMGSRHGPCRASIFRRGKQKKGPSSHSVPMQWVPTNPSPPRGRSSPFVDKNSDAQIISATCTRPHSLEEVELGFQNGHTWVQHLQNHNCLLGLCQSCKRL